MKIAQQRQYDLIADPSAIKFEQRHEGFATLNKFCVHIENGLTKGIFIFLFILSLSIDTRDDICESSSTKAIFFPFLSLNCIS